MKRLLLLTHRSPEAAGGPSARWRSLLRRLPEHGWEVEVLAAPVRASGEEFGASEAGRRQVAARATAMGAGGRMSAPLFGLAGVRPEAMPLSWTWLPRAVRETQGRLAGSRYDAVLATGPPMVALVAAARAAPAAGVPLAIELRDLWAENPAFDRNGRLLGRLEASTIDRAAAVIACTPEACVDLRARHPDRAERIGWIPNGFEPELLERRRPSEAPAPGRRLEVLHSGTLTADRPLAPLLDALARPDLAERFQLVLHGFLAPAIRRELAERDARVEVVELAPSGWSDAVERMAGADALLISQARTAGDATAVASKVYEYLALGRPVLCLSHGGATEAVLRRLGAEGLCARLDDPASISEALERLARGEAPDPVAPEALAAYSRVQIAAQMAELLDGLAYKGACS